MSREVEMMMDLYDAKGQQVGAPLCCGKSMLDDGECSEGCCDDFKCSVCGCGMSVIYCRMSLRQHYFNIATLCGKRLRVECGD